MNAPQVRRGAAGSVLLLRALYWRRVSRLTLGLLAFWLLVSVGVPWFALDLSQWRIGLFPLGFWLSAQGAIIVFVGLIAVYAWVMDRMDAALLAASDRAEQASEARR